MAEGENVAGEKKMGDLKMLPTIGSDVKYTSRCDAKCVVGIRVKGGDFWRWIILRTMGSDVKDTSRCDAKCVVGIRVKGGDFWRCDMGCVAGNRVVGGDETGTSAWMT